MFFFKEVLLYLLRIDISYVYDIYFSRIFYRNLSHSIQKLYFSCLLACRRAFYIEHLTHVFLIGSYIISMRCSNKFNIYSESTKCMKASILFCSQDLHSHTYVNLHNHVNNIVAQKSISSFPPILNVVE